MINIVLTFIEIVICYVSLYYLEKKYKNQGIYIYAIIATILTCITSLKTISIMEINIPIGFGISTSLIIAGNILTELNKKEERRNYLAIIFLTTIITASFLNLSGLIVSSELSNNLNEAYNNIFNYNLKVYLAITISIILSIYISSTLYNLIRKNQNKVAVSNIFSVIISTFIETIIFITIYYLFEADIIDIVLCIIFRYIIKILISILGTIPLYIISKNNQ